jgi:hypothetical protein
MNTKNLPVLMALILGAFGAATAASMVDDAAPKPKSAAMKGMKAMTHDHQDHLMMANEPHHLLAMAYHQNLMTFAKALHEQTAQATTVDVEFARTAEKEMRRSFAEMKLHHEGHVMTMSAAMQAKMADMRQRMEKHHTELITLLAALEKEVNLAKPDVKIVSTLAANIHTHCMAMENMEHAH